MNWTLDGYNTTDRRGGRQSRHDIQPKSRNLTDLEESVIAQYILDLDSKGFPLGFVV
jgi:hypothetical protein